jgi:hypothetical protein
VQGLQELLVIQVQLEQQVRQVQLELQEQLVLQDVLELQEQLVL